MITVLPCKETEEIKAEFEKRNLTFTDNSFCVKAKCDEETLGLCLFEIKDGFVTVLHIEPQEDIMLADGILRSALHVAAERFIFKANYLSDELTELFNKLAFIKDKENKILDMDKLFGGCGCKK